MRADRFASLRAAFQRFAQVEAPALDSPMYAELASGVCNDDELLEIAAHRRPEQPAPNILFAAVHYLLLSGIEHPLALHYPVIAGDRRVPAPALATFRDFCLCHRERIVDLVARRRTQTNVVRRCTCLLPAFSLVSRETPAPLALIDLGAGAGLNLNFDRYAYSYRRAGREVQRWGPRNARVKLTAELRGANALPTLAPAIPVASRHGIDLDPVNLADPDHLRWQRALIWPEHIGRHQQLIDAARALDQDAICLHGGDAADVLSALIDSVAREYAPVVYSTIALYQFSTASRQHIVEVLTAASEKRPVWQVALEGADPQLSIIRYRNGAGETEILADASAHGWWIAWK